MSARPLAAPAVVNNRLKLKIVSRSPVSLSWVRFAFWTLGIVLASAQAWVYRYQTSADSISYLDMSDGVMPGGSWHRLINRTWNPLYPFLLGCFRRIFGISPGHEIAAAHVLNIGFFALAFVCFEIFLASLMRRVSAGVSETAHAVPLPPWVQASIAYSLFLWGAISAISLEFLRPDMLLSSFFFLAAAMLLNMSGKNARWKDYLILGAVMGVGFLAKAAMWPIAALILLMSLFVVANRRPAIKMAVSAFALVFLIGSLYFIPLSRAVGRFTLGETGAYNYLVHVDRAGPGQGWYLENPGKGSGTFTHPPLRVFSSPPAYAFGQDELVTHPLRFDPAWWMEGVKPRIAVKRQIGESYASLIDLCRSLRWLVPVVLFVLLMGLAGPKCERLQGLQRVWPIFLLAIAGCGMYSLIHVEARYVAAFLVMFWCAALVPLQEWPRRIGPRILTAVTLVIVVSLLLPSALNTYSRNFEFGRSRNTEALAAAELNSLGIHPGDHVARISSSVTDLTIERVARVEVAAEVDFMFANSFWTSPIETQRRILDLFKANGAKAVIATRPQLTDVNRSEWQQLASGPYWIWSPSGQLGAR
jgi:hypothetical protein